MIDNYVTFLQKENKENVQFAVMHSMGQEKEQPFTVKDAPISAQKNVLSPTICTVTVALPMTCIYLCIILHGSTYLLYIHVHIFIL